jgi:hypothetical protein
MVAIVFVARFLPETKGRSLEQISELYEEEARSHGHAAPSQGVGPFGLQPQH